MNRRDYINNERLSDPLPGDDQPTGTEARVCDDITSRQIMGIQKYGTTVHDNPLALRAWLQHAYEETLDQAIYLKRAIEQLDRDALQPARTPSHPTT